MLEVIGLSSKCHELCTCLAQHGHKEDPLTIPEITDEEFSNITCVHQHECYPLTTASKAHTRIYEAYIHCLANECRPHRHVDVPCWQWSMDSNRIDEHM